MNGHGALAAPDREEHGPTTMYSIASYLDDLATLEVARARGNHADTD